MFVGHIGAGLAVKRLEPRLNLGVVLFAALFADLLLWVLVLSGVEFVGVPQTSGAARFFSFTFPYSHSLLASVCWSGLAGILGWVLVAPSAPARARPAVALALAVFSHFALDFLVHVPDLPIAGENSLKVGLGLWRDMPVALCVELLLSALGLALYLQAVRLSRTRALVIAATVLMAASFTALGPYVPGEIPAPSVLALSSLATLTLIVVLGFIVEGRTNVEV